MSLPEDEPLQEAGHEHEGEHRVGQVVPVDLPVEVHLPGQRPDPGPGQQLVEVVAVVVRVAGEQLVGALAVEQDLRARLMGQLHHPVLGVDAEARHRLFLGGDEVLAAQPGMSAGSISVKNCRVRVFFPTSSMYLLSSIALPGATNEKV